MSEFLDYYKNKKILVTGHTGFKGAWLSRILINVGAEVHGLSLKAELGSIFDRTGDFGFSSNIELDIRDRKKLDSFISLHKFDGVFHLAAQPLVRESYKQPVETFETNVMGSIHLMDSLLKNSVAPWAVMITTDKVYFNFEKLEGYKEDEPIGGKDPYSASKAATELAITAWQNLSEITKKTKFVSARAGNVIGGGDHSADRLLPDLVRGFRNNSKTIIRNPSSLRPWQHVLDPLAGYLKLGFSLSSKMLSKAYNFGPSEESKLTVLQMADIACSIWPENMGYEISSNSGDLPESNLLWLDSTLAQSELGWQSKLSAEQAIKWTLQWEQDSQTNGVLPALDAQINEYFGSL